MKIYALFLLISISKIVIPKCQINKNYCNKCNPLTDICVICTKNDILVPDEEGGCKPTKKCIAGKNYCLECDTNKVELCQKCDEGLYPDKNGGCSYSNYCKLSYNGVCLECIEDFILVGDQSNFKYCKSKFSDDFLNCASIDTSKGLCDRCENDYFLNVGDRKCIKTENCYESIFGNCVQCLPGFYFNKKEDKCIENKEDLIFCKQSLDGKKCDICAEYHYLSKNGVCAFTNFCSESEKGACSKCIEGYFLENNNICTNTENCSISDKDTGICVNCKSHFYLDKKDYQCKSNEENNKFKYCLIAENDNCISCDWTYYLAKDSKCCNTKFCEESENGKCILCEKGYDLNEDDFLCYPNTK